MQKMFPNVETVPQASNSCILTPLNKDVEHANRLVLERVAGDTILYVSADY